MVSSSLHRRTSPAARKQPWVFFNSWETGKATIWKVSVEGGEPAEVLPHTSFFPSVSPDGSLLAYIGDNALPSGKEKIFIVPLNGGSPIESFEGNFLLNWTPNGTGLTYPWMGPIEGQASRQIFNLWEQPLTSSAPRQLTKFSEPIFVHAWSRDGKKLAVLTAKYTSDVVLISSLK